MVHIIVREYIINIVRILVMDLLSSFNIFDGWGHDKHLEAAVILPPNTAHKQILLANYGTGGTEKDIFSVKIYYSTNNFIYYP